MDADLRWAMSTPWVAARLGIDPLRVERLRRAGELFAVRPAGSADWLYPSWQFETSGRVRPAVSALLRTARVARIPSWSGSRSWCPEPRCALAAGAGF